MKRPEIAPPRPWVFPIPRRTTLDNGLRVLAFQRPGQHLISASLVIDAPLSTEPEEIEGVSTIMLRCLDEGTTNHPGTSFSADLESRGAVFGGGTSHSAAQLSLEVPSTRFADALPLFAEAIRTPTLDESDVQRHVDLRLAEIAQQQAHPTHRGAQAFRAAVVDPAFRASRPSAGTVATVAGVTAQDVRAQHAGRYGPGHSTLVLAGDFGTDPLPLVADTFGDWTGQSAAGGHERPTGTAPRALLVHRPAAVQADVRIGTFGIDRTDPRWPALRLGAFVLGGGFLSRLNRVLREERGYTYGVQLSNAPARSGGMLAMHASFRTEVTAAAVAEATELLRVDGDRSITASELTEAVNFLIGITPLRCATASGITDQVAALVEAGLGVEFMDAHAAALQAVTPDEASAAVAELLPPEELTVVIVGDADVLAQPLTDQGLQLEVMVD